MRLLTLVACAAMLGLVAELPVAQAQELNGQEQAIVSALLSGESPGAIIERTGACADGGLIFGETGPAALVFVSKYATDEDGCRNTFARTNPDGTHDEYKNGVGAMFVILLGAPPVFIGSDGSYVHWTSRNQEGKGRTWTANGTLSDGSSVRLHFTTNAKGEPTVGRLWIEGRGYIVGAPASK